MHEGNRRTVTLDPASRDVGYFHYYYRLVDEYLTWVIELGPSFSYFFRFLQDLSSIFRPYAP